MIVEGVIFQCSALCKVMRLIMPGRISLVGFVFFSSLTSCYAQTENINLDQYKGKVVYLDFWAS